MTRERDARDPTPPAGGMYGDRTVRTEPIRLDGEDFAWMLGCRIEEILFAEPESWWICVGDGQIAAHGGTWRLLSEDAMIVCSADHGQPFGLPEPFDAIRVAREALRDARIVAANVRAGAPDLELRWSNGLVLEVLAFSRSHECWELRAPSGRCLVVNGSRDASVWHEAGPGA